MGRKRRWNGVKHPLIDNNDITLLRRAHSIHLEETGSLPINGRPMTVSFVGDMVAKLWSQSSDIDILLRVIIVVGLNLGLCFEKVFKLNTDCVSVSSEGIALTLHTQM